jgi:hypothetical protein
MKMNNGLNPENPSANEVLPRLKTFVRFNLMSGYYQETGLTTIGSMDHRRREFFESFFCHEEGMTPLCVRWNSSFKIKPA